MLFTQKDSVAHPEHFVFKNFVKMNPTNDREESPLTKDPPKMRLLSPKVGRLSPIKVGRHSPKVRSHSPKVGRLSHKVQLQEDTFLLDTPVQTTFIRFL